MKLKKSFSFSDKKQIWRILISESDKLVVETRDIEKKEVYFHCFDLNKGKKIFNNLQLDEKFWVGIEVIYKDIIYFHLFAKPNMPEHKKIIAYDLTKEEIIWQNDELTFLSLLNGNVYAIKKKFEGQQLYSLNYLTGEIIEDLGSEPTKINQILQESHLTEDFSNYRYPELYDGNENSEFSQTVESIIDNNSSVENIELLSHMDFIFFNYYIKSSNNLLDNVFVVYNIVKKKKLVSEVINKNLNSFSPDSFFCYKNFLILLKNKNEIVLYRII